MDRRNMLGVMGASALGFSALSATAGEKCEESCCTLDKAHEECLKACADCAKSCDMGFHHCLAALAEGKKEHAKALQLFSDCAAFCGLSACMIAKHSPLMTNSCHACAESCKTTAAEIEKHNSEPMKAVAKKLRECEASCRTMVANMKSSTGIHAN